MPILNYSTEVPPERTVSEITQLLVRKGARSITSDFTEQGQIKGVSFVMLVGGFPIRFLLPANVEGVARAMLREKPFNASRSRTRGGKVAYDAKVRIRARWVAWRILKDWVAAQIALIESEQAEAAQVFMPYAQDDNGRGMYQLWAENNQKRLTAGEPIHA